MLTPPGPDLRKSGWPTVLAQAATNPPTALECRLPVQMVLVVTEPPQEFRHGLLQLGVCGSDSTGLLAGRGETFPSRPRDIESVLRLTIEPASIREMVVD